MFEDEALGMEGVLPGFEDERGGEDGNGWEELDEVPFVTGGGGGEY